MIHGRLLLEKNSLNDDTMRFGMNHAMTRRSKASHHERLTVGIPLAMCARRTQDAWRMGLRHAGRRHGNARRARTRRRGRRVAQSRSICPHRRRPACAPPSDSVAHQTTAANARATRQGARVRRPCSAASPGYRPCGDVARAASPGYRPCAADGARRASVGSALHAARNRCMRTASGAMGAGAVATRAHRAGCAAGRPPRSSSASSTRHRPTPRHGLSVAGGGESPARAPHSAGGHAKSASGEPRTAPAMRACSSADMARHPAAPTARSRSETFHGAWSAAARITRRSSSRALVPADIGDAQQSHAPGVRMLPARAVPARRAAGRSASRDRRIQGL